MHREDEEPPPLRLPVLDPSYQSTAAGLYVVGDAAGKPTIKNAANLGRAVVEHMRRSGLRHVGGRRDLVDVAIVGAGPGGLSAALACLHHGLRCVVLEREPCLAPTVAGYPPGREIDPGPVGVRNVSFLPVTGTTHEALVELWQELARRLRLDVRTGETVSQIERSAEGLFRVATHAGIYAAQRVVVATGAHGARRKLGVPGEQLAKVKDRPGDPAVHAGQDVLVIGGGDSALETVLALAAAGARATLSYRGNELPRALAAHRLLLGEAARHGRLQVLLGSEVLAFSATDVTLRGADGAVRRLANDAAIVLLGTDPAAELMQRLGVPTVDSSHWTTSGSTDQLVESLTGPSIDAPRDAETAAERVLCRAPAASAGSRQAEPTIIRQLTAGAIVAVAQPEPPRDPAARLLLRALCDEGARLADDDARPLAIHQAAAPTPAVVEGLAAVRSRQRAPAFLPVLTTVAPLRQVGRR